jgi:hypothetical protein
MGGFTNVNVSCTEEYNGTSWSAGGAVIVARSNLAGAGTQNEALVMAGEIPAASSCTEEYNGTSWSVGGVLITVRTHIPASGGSQGAAFLAGGWTGAVTSCTEEYNKPLAIIDCIK